MPSRPARPRSGVLRLPAARAALPAEAGRNVSPQKSGLGEDSDRVDPARTVQLLAAWHAHLAGTQLFVGDSFNLDFHSVPDSGEHPVVERHDVSARSRRRPRVLVFLAQDAASRAVGYATAALRQGEAAAELFRFLAFWPRTQRGQRPRHLVFDSPLTTYAGLARLDERQIPFLTLRRRSPRLLKAIVLLPRSAGRVVDLDIPTRQSQTPRVYEQPVRLAGRDVRQLFLQDLGHDAPTILLTNQRQVPAQALVTRYAQRMLIEHALSDAVRCFHRDALSSAVGLTVDFDRALLVLASGLYRWLARRMRGYSEAQARQIFRDLVDMPADVTIDERQGEVRVHRRSHRPIVLASGLLDQPVPIPWWNGLPLRLTTYHGPARPPNAWVNSCPWKSRLAFIPHSGTLWVFG